MPAASASYAPPKRARARTRPTAATAAGRVRWDRLGRIAMLCVLVALAYLYISAGVRMFSTWRQAHHDSAVVHHLQSEHASLVAQHNKLSSQGALEGSARQLGMMRQGEQPYVVTHLPSN